MNSEYGSVEQRAKRVRWAQPAERAERVRSGAEQRDRDGLHMDAVAGGGKGGAAMERKSEGLCVIWGNLCVCMCRVMAWLPAVRGNKGEVGWEKKRQGLRGWEGGRRRLLAPGSTPSRVRLAPPPLPMASTAAPERRTVFTRNYRCYAIPILLTE